MEIKKIDLDQLNTPTPSPAPGIPKYNPQPQQKTSLLPTIIIFALVVVAGIFSGFVAKNNSGSASSTSKGSAAVVLPTAGGLKVGDIYGAQSDTAFKDKSTGVIDKGGISGEGTHKLLRPGGASQTVYLTSSVVDLDEFVGHQVTVWGETFKAQKAGWLMDVGRVKVEALNVPAPI